MISISKLITYELITWNKSPDIIRKSQDYVYGIW